MTPEDIVAGLQSAAPERIQQALMALFPGGSMLLLANGPQVGFFEAGMPGGKPQVVDALLGMGKQLAIKFISPAPAPQDQLAIAQEIPKNLPDLRTIGRRAPDGWPPEGK